MTRATFLAAYPEFSSASDALVDVMLAYAANDLSAAIWEDTYDQAQGLLTAHFLTLAPNGKFSRLAADQGKSTYQGMFLDLQRTVTMGLRVF